MADPFGALVTADDVETAVESTITTWIATYLAELERRYGDPPQSYPTLFSYTSATQFDHFAEDQLPACVIVSPGLLGEPEQYGNGEVSAEWSVGVVVIASGRDRNETIRLVRVYAAAIRWLVLQHSSLGGFATDTRWMDENYDDMNAEDARTMAYSVVQFGVRVDSVVTSRNNLGSVPPVDPYTPPPGTHTVEHVFVSVTHEE